MRFTTPKQIVKECLNRRAISNSGPYNTKAIASELAREVTEIFESPFDSNDIITILRELADERFIHRETWGRDYFQFTITHHEELHR